jgi:hypothetical protein
MPLGRILWPVLAAGAAALVVVSTGGATHGSPDYISNGHPISTPAGSSSLVACNVNNACFTARNDASGAQLFNIVGIKGELTGLLTETDSAAVEGENNGLNGVGVRGMGPATGVEAQAFNEHGRGVFGLASAQTGTGTGVAGSTFSTDDNASGVRGFGQSGGADGVRGTSNFSVGVYGVGRDGTGVLGLHEDDAGTEAGVLGQTNSLAADARAVRGEVVPTNPGAGSAAVRGSNNGIGANGYGVFGSQNGSGIGVLGFTPNGLGVLGTSGSIGVIGHSTTGYAGYFLGAVHVAGTLTKSAGSFRIDHPLDPARRYLQHSFVESPDMKNVYDGVVRTDRRGYAVVRLPRYFAALNRDFRYQLTTVGRASWGATVGVWREIRDNRFAIRSSRPRVKVSWQVTGIRRDAYANAHRIRPDIAKPARERGTYLHPELHGAGAARALVELPLR